MKNVFKIVIPCLMITTFTATAPSAPAFAVEADLKVKARIIRCVTPEERRNMCHTENMCCNLLDAEELASMAQAQSTDDGDDQTNAPDHYANDSGNDRQNNEPLSVDIHTLETQNSGLAMHFYEDDQSEGIMIE